MIYKVEIGRRLRVAIEAIGETQAEVARELGVSTRRPLSRPLVHEMLFRPLRGFDGVDFARDCFRGAFGIGEGNMARGSGFAGGSIGRGWPSFRRINKTG